jgi:Ca2+-binding RTX toxin-like protein
LLSYDFSLPDTHNAYAAKNYCKGVKVKDDGKNDFHIIIGSSQIGISECIIGTDDRDVILGLDGQDYIKGKDDNDNLQGGFSDDKLYGNDGNDNIQGGQGQDLVYGNDGNDVLFGGFDVDFISGGKGNDEMYGDFGEDMLEGGPGADYFDCGENYDIVLDYDPGDGDILANNCEQVIRAH